MNEQTLIVGQGCFWGAQHALKQINKQTHSIKTSVGYANVFDPKTTPVILPNNQLENNYEFEKTFDQTIGNLNLLVSEQIDTQKMVKQIKFQKPVCNPTYYNLDRLNYSEVVRIDYDPDLFGLNEIFSIIKQHSTNDPSPSTKIRYTRAIVCMNFGQYKWFDHTIDPKDFSLFLGNPIVFFLAEDYHQDYYFKKLGI